MLKQHIGIYERTKRNQGEFEKSQPPVNTPHYDLGSNYSTMGEGIIRYLLMARIETSKIMESCLVFGIKYI